MCEPSPGQQIANTGQEHVSGVCREQVGGAGRGRDGDLEDNRWRQAGATTRNYGNGLRGGHHEMGAGAAIQRYVGAAKDMMGFRKPSGLRFIISLLANQHARDPKPRTCNLPIASAGFAGVSS